MMLNQYARQAVSFTRAAAADLEQSKRNLLKEAWELKEKEGIADFGDALRLLVAREVEKAGVDLEQLFQHGTSPVPECPVEIEYSGTIPSLERLVASVSEAAAEAVSQADGHAPSFNGYDCEERGRHEGAGRHRMTLLLSLYLLFAFGATREESRAPVAPPECQVQGGVCIGTERERVMQDPPRNFRLRLRSTL